VSDQLPPSPAGNAAPAEHPTTPPNLPLDPNATGSQHGAGQQRRSLVLTATAAAVTALLVLIGPLVWRWHQQSRFGHLSLSTDVPLSVTAEVLDEEGMQAVQRFPLPTTPPIGLPAGSHALRLSSPGEMSETVQVLVEAGQHSEFPLKAAGRSGTQPLKTPEGFERIWPVVDLRVGGKAVLVGARRAGKTLERKDDRGLVRWEQRWGCEVVAMPADGGPPLWTYWADVPLGVVSGEGSEGMRKPPLLCQTDGQAILIVRFTRDSENNTQIHALDATTGQRLWHVRCPDDARDLAVVPSRGGVLVVCPAGDRFLMRDARTGKAAGPDLVLGREGDANRAIPTFASLGRGGPAAALLCRGGAGSVPSTLSVLELDTGRKVWVGSWAADRASPGTDPIRYLSEVKSRGVLATDLTGDGRQTVLVADHRLEAGERTVAVAALNGATGEELWKHALTKRCHKLSIDSIRLIAGPDLDGDGWRELFVASLFNGELFVDALSGKDGHLLWWRRHPLLQDPQRGIVHPLTLGPPCWWGVGADRQARLVVPVFVRRVQGGIQEMLDQASGRVEVPEAQLFVLSAGDGGLNGLVREAGPPSVADLNGDGLPDLLWAREDKWRFLPGMPPEAWRRLPPSVGVPSSLFYRAGAWKPDTDLDSDGIPDLVNAGQGRMAVISGRTGGLISWGDVRAARSDSISLGMDGVLPDKSPPLLVVRSAEGGSESVVWERSSSTVYGRSGSTGKPIWRCDGPGEPESILMPSQASEPPRVLFRLADRTLVCLLALPADPEGRYRLSETESRSYPIPPPDPRHERSLPWRPHLLEYADSWPGSRNSGTPLIEWLTSAEILPGYLTLLSLLFALVYWRVPFALTRWAWRRWSPLWAALPLIWLGLALWYIPTVPFFGESRFDLFGERGGPLFSDHRWLARVLLNGVFILLGLAGLLLLALSSWLRRTLKQVERRRVLLLLGGWAVLVLASGALWLGADFLHRSAWEHYVWRDLYLLPLLWLYLAGAFLVFWPWVRPEKQSPRRGAV
jgi:outer membrane protein assembly factor BamB